MVKRSTGDVEDVVLRNHLDSLNDEFSENIIELSAAPLADEPLLEDNQRGVYGTDYYVRKGSTIYVFSADSTITVT